jgi:tetratricopeptide (TPR) repeat protein
LAESEAIQELDKNSDLRAALQLAASFLPKSPDKAALQAEEILKFFPAADPAQHILGAAYRLQGRLPEALKVLEPLAARLPGSAPILHELGLCLGAAGRGKDAIEVLQKAVASDPRHAHAWLALGDQYGMAGNVAESQKAYEKHMYANARHPELIQAAEYLRNGNPVKSEQLIRGILQRDPTDATAMRLLAEIGIRVGRYGDARNLLERCLKLNPSFQLARYNYAVVLIHMQAFAKALDEIDTLLSDDPGNPGYRNLKGTVLVRKGDYEDALVVYEEILKDHPNQARVLMSYGHTLKTLGRQDEAIAAYRKSIEINPGIGETYWNLANLKTFRFTDDEIAAMCGQVANQGSDPEDLAHIAFALGKAYEDRENYDKSFDFYARGNAIRRTRHPHDPDQNSADTESQIKSLTADFFAARKGYGCQAPDPIFILGLPRAGSTLLEQILASHSQVEATAELLTITAISRQLGGVRKGHTASKYPEIMTTLSQEQFAQLGERYLEATRVQRHGKPFFIDKMPNNFLHIGLIHSILPNARIIDARRHPMAGCFAAFKQLFTNGQTFTYDLADIGRYYADYVRVMDHWDEVLPGRVHLVQYEELVADPEGQIRGLLEYCGLPFEEGCLRFYETDRAVLTPSAEQVRQPIYTDAVEQWRNYETHLGPLKEALGPLLERYPVD